VTNMISKTVLLDLLTIVNSVEVLAGQFFQMMKATIMT